MAGWRAQIRAVLLDLDGTLLDHDAAVAEALCGWLPSLGVTVTAEVVAAWAAVQERHLGAWREGRVSFQGQRRGRLRDFLPAVGVAFADDDGYLDKLFDGYLRWYEAAWRPFDDVDDALAALRRAGVATAVLTNGTVEQQTDKLARTGLLGRVGPVFAAEALGSAKPAATAYRAACARLGVPPDAVLNVGDRYDLDVVGARAAGLRAVHLDRTGAGPVSERSRITSLRDLVRFLPP